MKLEVNGAEGISLWETGKCDMSAISSLFHVGRMACVYDRTHLVGLGLTEQAHARVESTPVAYIKMQIRAA